MSLVDTFAAVKPAVCAIVWRLSDRPDDIRVIGTGFSVDPDGVVVTCRHVLEGFLVEHPAFPRPDPDQKPGELRTQLLKVNQPYAVFTFVDGDNYRLFECPLHFTTGAHGVDIAVSRIRKPAGEQLPSMKLGKGDDVAEGTEVAICGYPLGLALQQGARSMSSIFHRGIIASILPHPKVSASRRTSYRLDVNANPGNSGGPAFRTDDGSAIGIVYERPAAYAPVIDEHGKPTRLLHALTTGLTDAIPIERAIDLVEKVKRLTDVEIENFRQGKKPDWWGEA